MSLMTNLGREAALATQADRARALGSPFVADVLEAALRQLWRAPQTSRLITHWRGDPAAAALALRLHSAVHALARRGTPPSLGALYRREHADFDKTIGEAMAMSDSFIASWMASPTQTNEVARTAAFYAALMTAAQRFGLPFELLELGASCGLNLNLAHYAYQLGGLQLGQRDSIVEIAPRWSGRPPAPAPVILAATRGVDLNPLDPADAATRERLLSYIWPDQQHRIARLERALVLAHSHPPQVETGNAVDWLAAQLGQSAPTGHCRVVLHSMVLQYLSLDARQQIDQLMAKAGARATPESPLARIGFEWTLDRAEVQLVLTCWPDGARQCLALCHPYGDWIEWLP